MCTVKSGLYVKIPPFQVGAAGWPKPYVVARAKRAQSAAGANMGYETSALFAALCFGTCVPCAATNPPLDIHPCIHTYIAF